MAHLLRTAKSGSYWGQAELLVYNIVVKFQDATTFFGVKTLPQPAVAGELLNKVNANDMANDANYKLLRYMDLAMHRKPREESAVEDLAVHLLGLLDYVPRSRMARTRGHIAYHLWAVTRHENRCLYCGLKGCSAPRLGRQTMEGVKGSRATANS